MVRTLLSRVASLFRRTKLNAELDEELRAHIDLATEENMRGGMSRQSARTAALRAFGGVTQTREAYRAQRGVPVFETLAQDARYALRQLAKSPGFAATAILTVALGIGANTAIFSVLEGVVLAPLPFKQPDRLAILFESRPNLKHLSISYPDLRDWQHDARSFEQMAAMVWRDYNVSGAGASEHLDGMEVSSGFFSTLGVKLALGREFSPSEDMQHGAPVAIISDRIWKERFASSPLAIGKLMMLDGTDYTIVGILPARFRFITNADVYTSLAQSASKIYADRTIHAIFSIGRIKSGVSFGQAQGELNAIQQNLDRLYPAADRSLGTEIVPMKQEIVGDASGTLFLVMGAAGLVLLIACTNVANLLLARSAARTRELAIRSALGASRARIVCQLLTESVLLAIAGGILGLGLAKLGVNLVLAEVTDGLPRAESVSLNLPVLFFAFGITLGVGILFGLATALKSSRVEVQPSLKLADRGSTRGRHRGQSVLAIVQMALTLVLLVGSGLLLRTIGQLWQVNPGFDTHHILTFKVGLSPALTKTPSSTRLAFQQLLDRIRPVPGVQAADLTNLVPLSEDDNGGPFWLGTQAPASPQDAPHALYFWTGPDYLQTMKIPLLRGRYFTQADTASSERVIVIDSVLAHTWFPDKDPIGQIITVAHWGAARVIGVVGHVKHWGLNDPGIYNPSQIYICVYQLQETFVPVLSNYLTILVRTPLDGATVMPAIENVVYGTGKDQPVYHIESIEQFVSASMSAQRLPMILLGAFAVLALVLASVGIYGVLSYTVAQRVQEIGIRMALGARRPDVLRMVIGQGLQLAIVGVVIGAVAALALARLLSSFSHLLYGVRAYDPLTFIAVSLILMSAAFLACYIPARRAMRIDPMQALRTE
jgi:predicted permease